MGKRGPPPRAFTDEERFLVKRMAMIGIPQETIARCINTNETTLYKHFKDELFETATKANAAIAGALFKAAISGNVTAQIFWCKTRLRWRETNTLEHVGADDGPIQVQINFKLKEIPGQKAIAA